MTSKKVVNIALAKPNKVASAPQVMQLLKECIASARGSKVDGLCVLMLMEEGPVSIKTFVKQSEEDYGLMLDALELCHSMIAELPEVE